MHKIKELVEIVNKEHEGEKTYSYCQRDLIKKDMIDSSEQLKELTIKEIASFYELSYGVTSILLREASVVVKRAHSKENKARKHKMTKEEHEITFWATVYNKGKIRAVYYNMLKRCYNKENKAYARYGARGITVCEEWKADCKKFYKWAKENGYAEGLQLDRINNNEGYSPTNCRWVTPKENALNKECTRYAYFNGEKHTIKEWASITGLSYQVLADRIYRYGWSIERALTTPVEHS